MFRTAFLPIIRSSYPYISFGTFYAVVMTVCYQEQNGVPSCSPTLAVAASKLDIYQMLFVQFWAPDYTYLTTVPVIPVVSFALTQFCVT